MLRKAALLAVLVVPSLASADPIVGPGGSPGVAASWQTSKGTVVLRIKDGYSPGDVAAGIVRGVPGVKAETGAATVKVRGVDPKALLAALEKIDVSPALDDIDSAFAAIQDPSGGDDGSGSSIRATKAATMPGHGETVSGVVTHVRHTQFPRVALKIKMESGQSVLIIPRIVARKGVIAEDDEASQKNVAAWYARPGDRVTLTVSEKNKDYWIADSFARVR